jgi:hypothetical protein
MRIAIRFSYIEIVFLSGDFKKNMIFIFDSFIIRNGVTASASPNIPRSGSFLAIPLFPCARRDNREANRRAQTSPSLRGLAILG